MSAIELCFELLQVAVGARDCLSRVPTGREWMAIYDFACRQTLVGVMADGLERLPGTQRPPQELLLNWIGNIQLIEQNNQLMNARSAELVKQLETDGYRCIVLKGQGLAQLYPQPLRRMCGDIDVWITAREDGRWRKDELNKKRDDIVAYLRNKGFNSRVVYHNMPVHWLEDTEVEVHFTPSWMNCWYTNKRLQRWMVGKLDEKGSMCEAILNPGCETIPVPSTEFNMIFVLQHIYRHLIDGGIGLRQLLDYYYVLATGRIEGKEETVKTLRQLHMVKFSRAVMWVLGKVFGLEKEMMLFKPDEKEGRFLLQEILQSGNFGHYDKRNAATADETKMQSFIRNTKYNIRIMGHYPVESLSSPLFRMWHYVWRITKGYPVK